MILRTTMIVMIVAVLVIIDEHISNFALLLLNLLWLLLAHYWSFAALQRLPKERMVLRIRNLTKRRTIIVLLALMNAVLTLTSSLLCNVKSIF